MNIILDPPSGTFSDAMSTQTLQEQLYDGTNAVFLRLLTGDTDPTTPPYISVAIHVG
jgi:hypothetical protein